MNPQPATRDDFQTLADLFNEVDETVINRPPQINIHKING